MGCGSEIRKKHIPYPGYRDQKGTRSRIRIRNATKTGQVIIKKFEMYITGLQQDFSRNLDVF
jgi:hypothetical protein